MLPLVRPRPNSRNTARACPREAAIIVHVVAVADHDLANSPRAIMSGANPVPVAAPASNGGSLTANNDSKVANIAATLGNLDGKSLGLGPKLSALFQGMKKLSVAETQSCLQCSKKDVMRLAHNTSEIYCAGCISAVKSSLSSPWASWAAEPLSGILCECKKKKDVLRMQDDLCYPGVIAGLLQAHALETPSVKDDIVEETKGLRARRWSGAERGMGAHSQVSESPASAPMSAVRLDLPAPK